MRVLLTTWAWPSHLYCMVPLAWALRVAGHEVLVASQPELLPTIAGTGLPGTAVGHDVDAVTMVRGYLLPSVADSGRPSGDPPVSGRGPRALQMFLAHTESMLDDLVSTARRWRADAIVYEPTTWAGPLAAAAVGIPAIRHLYGLDLLTRARELMPSLLAPLAARHHLTEIRSEGDLTIDPCPPRLRLPSSDVVLPVRYTPFNGPGLAAPVLPPRRRGNRVCVTWGHTIGRVDPRRLIAGDVARALTAGDTEVVVAVSSAQQKLLGDLPPEVTVVRDAPLHTLLPQCDAVVAHGGAATTLTALHAGLPLLLVPQLPDHAAHAGRALATGAAAVLTRDEATPDRLRSELAELLDGGSARAAARELSGEMAQQPPVTELVPQLTALVRDRTPVG